MNEEISKKPAWKRPENWFTWGGLAIAGYFLLRGLDVVLPLLNRVLENLLYTSVLAGGLAIVGYVLFSKDLHKLGWYAYKMAMKWVTRRFIEIDPIAIMETYVGTLREKLQTIIESLNSLYGQQRRLENLIKQKSEEFQSSMQKAAIARSKGDQEGMRAQFTLQARKAGRLEKSTMTYQGLVNQIKKLVSLMKKVKEVSEITIADMDDTVKEEREKRDTIGASFRAMGAAKSILAADSQREMYDTALEITQQEYYTKFGAIEQFMNDAQSAITSMDLDNGVYDADALERLNKYTEDGSFEKLLSGRVRIASDAFPTEEQIVEQEALEQAENEKTGRQSYADLFK